MTARQRIELYSLVAAAVVLTLLFTAGPGLALLGVIPVALAAGASEVLG